MWQVVSITAYVLQDTAKTFCCQHRHNQNKVLLSGKFGTLPKTPTRNLSLKSQDMYKHSPLIDESWDGMVDLEYGPTGHQGRHAVGDIGLGCQPD